MAERKSTRRKILRWAGSIFLFLLLFLAALPIWFPWALELVALPLGLKIGSFDRLGYSRLAIRDAQYRHSQVDVSVAKLEIPLPPAWIWDRLVHSQKDPRRSPVQVDGWEVIVRESTKRSQTPKTNSTHKVITEVHRYVQIWEHWLPLAHLSHGTLSIQDEVVRFPDIQWQESEAKVRARFDRWNHDLALAANLKTGAPYVIAVAIDSLELSTTNELSQLGGVWALAGKVHWLSNEATLKASFEPGGWLPSFAQVEAPGLVLPLSQTGIEGYPDATGSMIAQWDGESFTVQIDGAANPASTDSWPPAKIVVQAHGDLKSITTDQFELNVPGLRSQLSTPLTFSYRGELLSGAAQLGLAVDASKWPPWGVTGTAQGTIFLRPAAASNFPEAQVSLRGTNLARGELTAPLLALESSLRWPVMSIDRLRVDWDNGSSLVATGAYFIDRKELTNATWNISGPVLQSYWPANIRVTDLHADGTLSGSLTAPRHTGRMTLTGISYPQCKDWDAFELLWQGADWKSINLEAQLRAHVSTIHLKASVEAAPDYTSASALLHEVRLLRDTVVLYSNSQPALVRFESSPKSASSATWILAADGPDLRGPAGRIRLEGHVRWPLVGNVDALVEGLRPETFVDFVKIPTGQVSIEQGELRARWTNGPIDLQLGISSTIHWAGVGTYEVSSHARSIKGGFSIDDVSVRIGTNEIITAEGVLPVQLDLTRMTNRLQVGWQQPLQFQLRTRTNEHLWERVSALTGVRLGNPDLRLELLGTPAEPAGAIVGRADLLQWQAWSNHAPSLENFVIDVRVRKNELKVETLAFDLSGQPVRASARLPLPDQYWADLASRRALPDLNQASGDFLIENAQVSAFAAYLPAVVTPQGRINLAATLRPPLELKGVLQLTNLATRPLATLGPVRDVHSTIRFDQRRAKIEQFGADIGGAPISLEGEIEMPGTNLPPFVLHVRGNKVPLVREPGILLRANVDLHLIHTNTDPVLVAGKVELQPSLFLQDLKSLIPGGRAQPNRRPPYFSVDLKPFADWNLDLNITGDRFLKVRSPLFRGEVSTALRLRGDLEEPQAWGEVRIAQGVVQFPFGSLKVEQGLVNLTSENPYDPQLLITAASRVFGYEVKLEITGTASTPVIAFTSTPPLSSEEIVLMVTAGELPRNDVRFSSSQKASRLAVFLGKDIVARLTGNESAADRLTITSGESVSEQGDPTYQLEYKLSDRWSVTGESDRFNELNAGIKWQLYSK